LIIGILEDQDKFKVVWVGHDNLSLFSGKLLVDLQLLIIRSLHRMVIWDLIRIICLDFDSKSCVSSPSSI
jgi:hypothetical protein